MRVCVCVCAVQRRTGPPTSSAGRNIIVCSTHNATERGRGHAAVTAPAAISRNCGHYCCEIALSIVGRRPLIERRCGRNGKGRSFSVTVWGTVGTASKTLTLVPTRPYYPVSNVLKRYIPNQIYTKLCLDENASTSASCGFSQARTNFDDFWQTASAHFQKQEAQLMLTNPRDAFRGQSRSPNTVPFHMLCTFPLLQ